MAAAKNWYLTGTTANSWRTVDEATQAATLNTDGWIVSTTGDSTTSSYNVAVERAATTFSGSTQPDGTLDTSLFDAFRTTNAYTGSFASANWTFSAVVRAVTSAGTHTGAVVIRLLRSANADGSSATQITAAQQTGTTTAAMAATGTDYTSTVTFNPGAFSLTNEYLFFQIAWKRIAAGGMTSSDANWMKGSSASVGTRIVSSTLTPAHPTTGALVGTGKVIAGTASSATTRPSSGALIASGKVIIGTAAHISHPTIAAITADAFDFATDTTPTLEFVGSDPENDDLRYQIQILAPSMTADSYALSNFDGVAFLSAGQAEGQSFHGVNGLLTSVTFYYVLNQLATTGTVVAKLYSHSGTYGSSSVGATLLATSDSRPVTDFHSSGISGVFTFSRDNQYLMASGTDYVIVLEVSGDADNDIGVGYDSSSPTHSGNAAYRGGAPSFNWSPESTGDLCFLVTAQQVLLDKTSGTDAGFVNQSNGADTDPFTSGNTISYTVQTGDELATGTWYWSVRAKDPSGGNTFSHWTTARSFTVTVGAATHATSGVMAGPGTTLAGTATNFTVHATSGILAKNATLTGIAARTRVHADTGILTATGKVVVGSANRTRAHATTGIIAGTGKIVVGTARRFRAHAATSVLVGAGKVIAGTAARTHVHAATGILSASGKVIAGTAVNFTVHPATGALPGRTAAIVGTARNFTVHAASGTLAGVGKVIAGTSARSTGAVTHTTTGVLNASGRLVVGAAVNFTVHPSTGVLAGVGKVMAGIAAHVAAAPGHVTSGILTGTGKVIAGTALHRQLHATSGALHGAVTLAGTARHLVRHVASGALPGHFALLAASAQHAGAAHNALGNLIGSNAIVVGRARLADLYAAAGALAGAGTLLAGECNRKPPLGVQPGGIPRMQAGRRGIQISATRPAQTIANRPAAVGVAQRASNIQSGPRSRV